MLIDFEVENFRSYRDRKRFSFVASKASELPGNVVHFDDLGIGLLKTAVIYGANGSGKTNLLIAMHSLSTVLTSWGPSPSPASFSPFGLDQSFKSKPSRFKARFLFQNVLFEYYLAIGSGAVEEERLTVSPKGRPQEWFTRTGNKIQFKSPYLKGPKKALSNIVQTRPEWPLLAVAIAFAHPQLSAVAGWLVSNLANRMSSINSQALAVLQRSEEVSIRLCYENADFRKWVELFLRHADIGIQRLGIKLVEQKVRRVSSARLDRSRDLSLAPTIEEVTEERPYPFFVHSGEGGVTAEFELGNESHGTRRLFSMLAPLYQVLKSGQLAIVDELSASIHPTLVRELIRVFHDPQLNPKNAQLLFATHDASLLNGRIFRRDQVWFTEKSTSGATDLYSLSDIKDVRKEEAFEDGYLRGRYGAIPFFTPFNFPAASDEFATNRENES